MSTCTNHCEPTPLLCTMSRCITPASVCVQALSMRTRQGGCRPQAQAGALCQPDIKERSILLARRRAKEGEVDSCLPAFARAHSDANRRAQWRSMLSCGRGWLRLPVAAASSHGACASARGRGALEGCVLLRVKCPMWGGSQDCLQRAMLTNRNVERHMFYKVRAKDRKHKQVHDARTASWATTCLIRTARPRSAAATIGRQRLGVQGLTPPPYPLVCAPWPLPSAKRLSAHRFSDLPVL